MFENIKRKENFQQMFYASLYLNTNKNQKLIIGVYPLKKLSGGIFWFEDEPITWIKSCILMQSSLLYSLRSSIRTLPSGRHMMLNIVNIALIYHFATAIELINVTICKELTQN
jgi:hypothetical protein